MTTEEKLQWVRDNWDRLIKNGQLKEAIQRIVDADKDLKALRTVEEIIDFEESLREQNIQNV